MQINNMLIYGVLDGKYNIKDKKGKTKTTIVYKVEDQKTNKIYAAKVLEDNESISYFDNEIEILTFLKDKNIPNIIKMKESGKGIISTDKIQKQKPYIILDFMKNGELSKYIYFSKKGFEQKYAKYIFYKILKTVQSIHNNKVCHIDLKLSNIVLDADYHPVICDFGFSRKISEKYKLKAYLGTRPYVAPEIIKNIPYDGIKADIFSLGVILFHLVLGKECFEEAKFSNENYKLIKSNSYKAFWSKFSEANDDYEDFKKLFFEMVSCNPKKRPPIEKILENKWFDGIKDLKDNEIEEIENEIKEVFGNKEQIIINYLRKIYIYNNNKGIINNNNKSFISNKKEYFECDANIKEINEGKCMNYYLTIKGNLNPVEFMNDLAYQIDQNFQFCSITIKNKKKLKFKVLFEEKEEEEEEEEVEEKEEEQEQENDDEIKEEEEESDDNKIKIKFNRNLVVKIELLKSDNDIYYLVFLKNLGSLEDFYKYLEKLYSITEKIVCN